MLDHIISNWPGVEREETSQIAFSVGRNKFCWLSYGSRMVQLSPPLGPKSITRSLKRVDNKVEIVHPKRIEKPDIVYDDPQHLLKFKFSYPGFTCKHNLPDAYLELADYLYLIRQSYKTVETQSTIV